MVRFSQAWDSLEDEEKKRRRLETSGTRIPASDDLFNLCPLQETPLSPEIDVAEELSQRVTLEAERLLDYGALHARLASLSQISEVSVARAFSKAELLCMLQTNGIQSCRESHLKGYIVSEVLRAVRDKRISPSPKEGRQAPENVAVDENGPVPAVNELIPDDDATQPPSWFNEGPGKRRRPSRDFDLTEDMSQPEGSTQPLKEDEANEREPPAERRTEAPPPPTLQGHEEEFFWKVLTGQLQANPAVARDASTQTAQEEAPLIQTQEVTQPVLAPEARGPFTPATGGQETDSLINKIRRLLKRPSLHTDEDIRQAYRHNRFQFLPTVDALRQRERAVQR